MNKDQKYENFTIAPLVNSLYMKLPRRGISCLTLREVQNPEKLRSLEVDLIYLTDVIFIAQPFLPTLRRSCTRAEVGWLCKKVCHGWFLSIQSKLHVHFVEDVVGSTYTRSDLRMDRPGYNPMIGRLGTDIAVAGVLGFWGYRPCHLQRFVDQMMQEDG